MGGGPLTSSAIPWKLTNTPLTVQSLSVFICSLLSLTASFKYIPHLTYSYIQTDCTHNRIILYPATTQSSDSHIVPSPEPLNHCPSCLISPKLLNHTHTHTHIQAHIHNITPTNSSKNNSHKMDIKLAKPITLPSGLTLPNRLLNAAMTEQMAGPSTNYLPSEAMNRSYAAWAEGGWGMVATGNVEVDSRYLGGPNDTAMIDDEAQMLEAWTKWAKAGKGPDGSTPFVMQVNHPGRQSPVGAGTKGFFEKNLAPSAIPMRLGDGFIAKLTSALVFGTPRAMTAAECEDVVSRFARTARVAAKAGFDGIEIHAAHGYLLAQFLSARSNTRTDAYGGTPVKRAKIVVDIIKAVRDATPAGFTVGIKLNSVDHQTEAAMSDCIEQLQVITGAGVDFLEVSGGTYEDPTVSYHSFVSPTKRKPQGFPSEPPFPNHPSRCSWAPRSPPSPTGQRPARPSSSSSPRPSAPASPMCP